VNYRLEGVSVAQSLYTGPHKVHADKAYATACVLGQHGILKNCRVTFFDGFRLRKDYERDFRDEKEVTN
jgi:hypothetical protein